MVTVAKLNADLTTDTSSFEQGMQRGKRASKDFTDNFNKNILSTTKSLTGLSGEILGINSTLANVAIGGGLIFLAKEALDSADAVSKLAQKLGLTTDQIQQYQYAAKQSNVSNELLQTGFNNLNKLIAEGKVPYTNLQQAINDVANRMASAANGSQRAQIAFEAFGKTGVNLIPLFSKGAIGLKALGDEAVRLGAVLPAETIQRAEDFKTQLDTMGTVIKTNFQASVLDGFTKNSQTIHDIYSDPQFIAGVKALGEDLGGVLKFMVDHAETLLAVTGAIGGAAAGAKVGRVFGPEGAAFGGAVGAIVGGGTMLGEGGVSEAQQAKGIQDEIDRVNKQGTNDFGIALDEQAKARYLAPLQAQLDRIKVTAKDAAVAVGSIGATSNKPTGSGSILLPQAQNQLDKYRDSLNAETDAIGQSERALSIQKDVILAQNAARTDYENHLRVSPALTAAETAEIQQSAGRFYDLKVAQQEAEKYNQEFKNTFMADAGAVVSGSKSMGDALKDLVVQFAKLAEQEAILGPLADGIFGSKGTGGLFGGGIAGLFSGAAGGLLGGSQGSVARLVETGSASFIGPLPVASYDVGTPYVPNDMTANIHKGEAVLTPQQAAAWRSGQGNGDTYYVSAPGASKHDIAALTQTLMALAGPGRVEERISQAQKRGKL